MRTDAALAPGAFAAMPVLALAATGPALAIAPSPQVLAGLACAWFGFTLFLRHLARWRWLPAVQGTLAALVLGYLGFVAGVRLDLGPAGLTILASWCSVRSDYGLADAWAMMRVAPWAHAGMMLGCNLGMWLGGCGGPVASRRLLPRARILVLCNLGMLGGMLLVALVPPLATVGSQASAVGSMLLQMTLGMGAGMAGASWLALRGRR